MDVSWREFLETGLYVGGIFSVAYVSIVLDEKYKFFERKIGYVEDKLRGFVGLRRKSLLETEFGEMEDE